MSQQSLISIEGNYVSRKKMSNRLTQWAKHHSLSIKSQFFVLGRANPSNCSITRGRNCCKCHILEQLTTGEYDF